MGVLDVTLNFPLCFEDSVTMEALECAVFLMRFQVDFQCRVIFELFIAEVAFERIDGMGETMADEIFLRIEGFTAFAGVFTVMRFGMVFELTLVLEFRLA